MQNSISKKDALSAAMRLCSKEERCINDVREKLEKWGLPEQEAEEVIAYLVEHNFLNEMRYANAFVNDKFRFHHWGRVKLRHMLRLKQLPGEIIENSLSTIDENEYLSVLKSEMTKKLNSLKEGSVEEKKARLYRFGISHGFENEYVYKIMEELL